ncbi:MAG: hypothetical protein AAGN66_07890 [Acidobacteriota bacterium]
MARKSQLRSILGTAAVALAVLLVSTPSALLADDDGSEKAGPLSKLQVHGFLTQAFATGNYQTGRFPTLAGPAGPTAEEISLGIPENGTTDYRNLALQFRYEISPEDIMIVQLSSRSLGISPISESEEEVELDWAFYERRLNDTTSLKVGRVQIPYGIFNEIRDVGTILPFYRPAFVFYREGSFTSETVDGVLLSHTFGAESDWAFEANVYAGEWDLVEIDPVNEVAEEARSEDSWGTQFWLNTPIYGLRFGFGTQRRNVVGGSEGVTRVAGSSSRFDEWTFSLDAAFDTWVFRSEYSSFENEEAPFPGFFASDFVGQFDSYYFQAGYYFTPKIRLYVQAEFTEFDVGASIFTEQVQYTAREDFGIALNYSFSPSVVLKAEYHEVEGEDLGFLQVGAPTPPFFQLQPIYADIDGGDYTIISLSASF